MLVIVVIDSMLKLAGTKKKLELTSLNYDHEVELAGWYNILNSLCVAAPGYPQLKFNVLNHGIVGNTSDRLPGIIMACLPAWME